MSYVTILPTCDSSISNLHLREGIITSNGSISVVIAQYRYSKMLQNCRKNKGNQWNDGAIGHFRDG